MSTETAFLRVIRDQPEDDLPRLVYADWLDERGQSERAEFIRVQCELAACEESNPRRHSLNARSDELVALHRQEWTAPLHELPAYCLSFRRGFIDRIVLADFGEYGTILPVLRETLARNAVTDLKYRWSTTSCLPENRVSELLRQAIDWQEFQSLRRFELAYIRSHENDNWEDEEIEHLTLNTNLSKLNSLKFGSNVSPSQLAQLGRGAFVLALRHLRAQMGREYDAREWCRAWKFLPFLPRLTELDLAVDWHTDETLATLLEADLADVQSVDLRCNDFTEGVLTVLARWPQLRQIQRLDLSANNLGPTLLSQLAALPLDGLRSLSFGGEMNRNRATGHFFTRRASMDPGSFHRFAQSPLAGQLNELLVTQIISGGPLLSSLAEATLPELTKLNLYQVEFERSDLQQLFTAEWFGRLRYLRIGIDPSTDAEAELFLDCPLHPEATLWLTFSYSNCQVSDELKEKLREKYGSRITIIPD